MRRILWILALAGFLVQPVFAASPDGVPRTTVDELNAKIERGEDIVILDVRTGRSYSGSMVKIKGAIRIAPRELNARVGTLPMGKEIVTYCT